MRGKNHFIAVFEVRCDEVIEKRPFEPCAVAAIEPVTVAGKFNASLVIDYSEVGAKVHVVLRFEIENRLFAEYFYDFVVLLFAGEKVVVRHVGKFRDEIGYFLLISVDFRVALGDFVADFSHAGENFINGLALFFILGNLGGNLVSLGFFRLDFAHEFLSFGVEFKNFGKIDDAAFFGESFFNEFRIFGDKFYVEHFYYLFKYFYLFFYNAIIYYFLR